MDLDTLRKSGAIILECISGSKAYGLATPTSDTDIKGVFILPQNQFFSLNQVEQINNESNDIVYYELRKFIELLKRNNPNILELLNMPKECILYKHPLFDQIRLEFFLSKLCENSFANYAFSQIKKARGLNKKIVNPMPKERKSIIDFCYVYNGKESVLLQSFLNSRGWEQQYCGLSVIPHINDCYNLFYDPSAGYQGVLQKNTSNEVSLSSIPKGETPIALLYYNKNAYSGYCKEYKEYREWEEKRNQERYHSTIAHSKNYDAKNMMHTYRLLLMAKEIALTGELNVARPDREFLLDIKRGKFEYDELVNKAAEMKDELSSLFAKSSLPEAPDEQKINKLLITIRKQFYTE
jgi:predicted nucleotidyltransferase